MKKWKKLLSIVVSLCMLATLMTPMYSVLMAKGAAESYKWVLDDDGIDAGAEYLIVNGTSSPSVALMRDDAYNIVRAQSVVVRDGNTIEKFDGDENCAFVFSDDVYYTNSATNCTIQVGDYYLNIGTGSVSFTQTEQTIKVRRYAAGYYRISANVQSRDRYVRYNNGSWSASTLTSNANLYLFKKVVDAVSTYAVTYHDNGATSGTLPENVEGLYANDTITVGTPIGLEKIVNDNTYRFHCWNTAADGNGTDYMPGAEMQIGTADVVLYAKWYLVPKHTITVRCNVDNQPHDIPHNHGTDVTVYVSRDEITYLPLTKISTGVYETTVEENGDYQVYFGHADGTYETAHGHRITIFNQGGETVLQNFTVTYDKGYYGDPLGDDTDGWYDIYHGHTAVYVTDVVPVRKGYYFDGWADETGAIRPAGSLLSEDMTAPIVLTAQWKKIYDVQVEITLDHNSASGGFNNTTDRHEVRLQLMQLVDGVYLPVGDPVTLNDATHFDEQRNITTYSYTFANLPQGEYTVSPTKTGYQEVVTVDENGVIHVVYTYVPESFDLDFTVKAKDGTIAALRPVAVNIRVLYWGYDVNGKLGWHIITQHGDGTAPVTVTLDENGVGYGSYTVWKNWADYDDSPYLYRLMVSSFVMPDGTVVAAGSNDFETYTPNDSGLYTATLEVSGGTTLPNGPVPAPGLDGVYYDGTSQQGDLTLIVDVHPYTVLFDAGVDGTIQGNQTLEMREQYIYPNLDQYIPVSDGLVFDGWYLDAACTIPATNHGGAYLTGDVTYYAGWRNPLQITGTVVISGTYQQNGETVSIHQQDRATEAMVLLLKETAGAYNVVDSQLVSFGEQYGDQGSATYCFDIRDASAIYRIQVLELNYTSTYDNNGDGNYSSTEYAVPSRAGESVVDVRMDFVPEIYTQTVQVDATKISESYRPTGALIQYDYRDLGSYGSWTMISQHSQYPYGLPVQQGDNGIGTNGYAVWNWHTDGVLYEYQARLSMLYGNTPGVYEQEGTPYSNNLPYTVQYGTSAWYSAGTQQQTGNLSVTLVPKQYEVIFDLGDDFIPTDVVSGMEHLITAGPDGDYYAYRHTWSYGDKLIAFPFREGYIFRGWISDNDGVLVNNIGEITIATGLAENVTLRADWEKIESTVYIVRYLELNTNKVLRGSKMVQAPVGGRVYAADEAVEIADYVFDSASHTSLVVSENNEANTLILYYLPDGSNGYTEQVEGNLHLDKSATLENDGTYTVWMETFTTDNPVTTLIQHDTPMDIVLVLDQSASMYDLKDPASSRLHDLKDAVNSFIDLIASHGHANQVDHRIAMVGYASNNEYTGFTDANYPNATLNPAVDNKKVWCNTGVFDSHGVFHKYTVTGFNYTEYADPVDPDADDDGDGRKNAYYTYAEDQYLLLTYHSEYYHVMTEVEARTALLWGSTVYGYVYNDVGEGRFVTLTRNSSGLWLYEGKQLYSGDDFYTYHTDVWTHRNDTGRREIHAYGTKENFAPMDSHDGVYVRTETTSTGPQQSIYADAMVPVTTGAEGTGGVTPGLRTAVQSIGANGTTYVSYGMKMANSILEATQDTAEGRLRIVVVFTDGKPGDSSNFDENESNAALAEAYKTGHTYGAEIYTVGVYGDDTVSPESDQDFFMNGLSSNYPDAQSMDDVWIYADYREAETGYLLDNGGPYFVKEGDAYREITKQVVRGTDRLYYVTWGYTDASGNRVVIDQYENKLDALAPMIQEDHTVNGYTIYRRYGVGYEPAASDAYHVVAESADQLKEHFANIVHDITTSIKVDIILHEDTILRDIMGQGLVLTDGTVITAYKVAGDYNFTTNTIDWARDANGDYVLEYVASLELASNKTASDELASIKQADGTEKLVPYIQVYNYGSANPTDPLGADYHPHTVDVTGYDFSEWYIDEKHPDGYMMVVQISRIEAMDNVQWGRSTNTNNDKSGLWLPADENGDRELLLAFQQPKTIFVERAYVLDYGKPFTVADWYFDDDTIDPANTATPIHIDGILNNGMNWFDTANPALTSGLTTKYGNVHLDPETGEVTYTPTTMLWDGMDQFYVFGNTWRKTVQAQDANENGNLWTKVQVIPANSVYYEDSFITVEGAEGQNGVDGFTFTGDWSTAFDGTDADNNGEIPEHLETPPYGDVHGWIDAMVNEGKFADGSAHFTDEIGAKAEFTFTGSGVDVYTRTNHNSGVVVATIYRLGTYDAEGNYVHDWVFYDGQIMDNLAVSGDYYHIPTISFMGLPHGTYRVELIATAATVANTDDDGNQIGDEAVRTEYHIDGIRVYKPLAANVESQSTTINTAYGQEVNSTFTEVRDVLLEYEDFNADIEDSTNGTMGAVFIDWIRSWQGTGDDQPGVGVPTYEIGTFEAYGPKNEVYLTSGQAVVLKVDPNNIYYVGLKSLEGTDTIANVSGITTANPVAIQLNHSIDLYYQITPVDGYIVIQNGASNDSVLSVTKLRTTNKDHIVEDGGILPVTEEEVVDVMTTFSRRLMMNNAGVEGDEGLVLPVDPIMESFRQFLRTLFADVRAWMYD